MDFIGIDLGTSAMKLLLVGGAGEIKAVVSKEYPLLFPRPAWSEQEPAVWWDALLEGVTELLDGRDRTAVAGIGVGGQMHGLVCLDAEDCVTRPAILWNDGRTAEETEWLNTALGKERLSALTANIAFAGFTAPKLLWMKRHEPENFARIAKLMLPKDYLNYRLTGVHACDCSDASGTLLLDVEHRHWSREMLDVCGVSEAQMPRLFESCEVIGTLKPGIAAALGLSPSVRVVAGAGDNAAAAVGTGTVGDGACNISLGTSGTVFISSERFGVDPNNALHAFCHADGAYHLMGCMLSAASRNPLAFKYYDAEKLVMGKPMREHFPFAMAWWHNLCAAGTDMFGRDTADKSFGAEKGTMEHARARVDAGIEFMRKLGIRYFCFHDVDLVPEAEDIRETNRRLDEIGDYILEKMRGTDIRCLWGTANLFSNPRYMNGAGSSNSADVFCFAAAQVKKALDLTVKLGGRGYVFWGGREGYETLLNTDVRFEQENIAALMRMAVEYGRSIGFTGDFYIEPKPKEPMKHQYDFDAATAIGFLRQYGLDRDFKLNIAAMCMYEVLKCGGLTGGFNFDSKTRRPSYTAEDMFHAYILGMDTFALGLIKAAALIEDGRLDRFIEDRYASYRSGVGAKIRSGKATLAELAAYADAMGAPALPGSGRQEYLESIVNQVLFGSV